MTDFGSDSFIVPPSHIQPDSVCQDFSWKYASHVAACLRPIKKSAAQVNAGREGPAATTTPRTKEETRTTPQRQSAALVRGTRGKRRTRHVRRSTRPRTRRH